MKLDDVKIKNVRGFLAHYNHTQDCPFTKKGLWYLQKECWSAELELYHDYNSYLNHDQVDKIFDDGLDGYYAVCDELLGYNWDYICDIKDTFIKELDIDGSMLSLEFKQQIMQSCECSEEEVVEEAKDEIAEFIGDFFQDELEVDLKLDTFLDNTSGKVYVDIEDVYLYDLLDTKKLDLQKLLFATIRNPTGTSEKELFTEELGEESLEDLDEVAEMSLCIAESLSDYIDLLVEAENNKLEEEPAELYYMAKRGNVFIDVDRDNLHLLTEPNYESHGFEVEFMDKKRFKETPCNRYEDYYSFSVHMEDLICANAEKIFSDELFFKEPYWRDPYGRTLVHYALYLGKFEKVATMIGDSGKLYLLYKEDDNGVSPLSIALAMFGQDPDNSLLDIERAVTEVKAYFGLAYFSLLNALPRLNQTASQWYCSTSLLGKIDATEYAILESSRPVLSFPNGIDIVEHGLGLDLLVSNLETGEMSMVPVKDFENIFPINGPVEVCLDGSIAV